MHSFQLVLKWIQLFDQSIDNHDVEVKIGVCRTIQANREICFEIQNPTTNHEKALHQTLTTAILKLIIDDDYEIRQMVAVNIMPKPKASLLLFEEMLNRLKDRLEYKTILESIERELEMVSLCFLSSIVIKFSIFVTFIGGLRTRF